MASESVLEHVRDTVNKSPAVIFSKSYCPYCNRAKKKLQDLKIEYVAVEVNLVENQQELADALFELTNQRTFPNIFIKGIHVGGCDDLFNKLGDGTVQQILSSERLVKT